MYLIFEYYSNNTLFVFVFGHNSEPEYYSYSYSAKYLCTNIIRIRIRSFWENEYYSYSYSVKILIPNIIRIRIRSKKQYSLTSDLYLYLFVFVHNCICICIYLYLYLYLLAAVCGKQAKTIYSGDASTNLRRPSPTLLPCQSSTLPKIARALIRVWWDLCVCTSVYLCVPAVPNFTESVIVLMQIGWLRFRVNGWRQEQFWRRRKLVME